MIQITLANGEARKLGDIEMQVVAYFWGTPTITFLQGNPLGGNAAFKIVADEGAITGARLALICPTKSLCGEAFTSSDGKARAEFDYGRIYLEKCQEPTCDPAKRIPPDTL